VTFGVAKLVVGDGARCLPRAGQEVTGLHPHHWSPPSGLLDSHLTSLSGSRFERVKGPILLSLRADPVASLPLHTFLTHA
jgi:hypothetical protein